VVGRPRFLLPADDDDGLAVAENEFHRIKGGARRGDTGVMVDSVSSVAVASDRPAPED